MAETQAKDGAKLSYTLHPAPGKPRLALIHSLALDRSIWDPVVGALAGEFEILAHDARGHGLSEHRPGPYTVKQFADDLAAIFDAIGWGCAIVAGCSMGGCIAQAFAIAHPQRTQALALIDTTAWYGAEAPKQWRERAATAEKDGLQGMMAFQGTRWFSDGFRERHPELVARLGKIFVANDLACYRATCEMLGDADLRDAMSKLTLPTAVIVGEEDYATPVAMAEDLNRRIAGSSLTVIKGGRHITPAECPQEIAGLLRTLAGRVKQPA
jgi:3-oxoadipate enol-lactonase